VIRNRPRDAKRAGDSTGSQAARRAIAVPGDGRGSLCEQLLKASPDGRRPDVAIVSLI